MTEASRAQEVRQRWIDPASPRSVLLWAGIAVPPLAWAVQLVMGDLLFELGCAPGVGGRDLAGLALESWIVVVSAAAAAATVAAGAMSFGAWRRLRGRHDGAAWDRAHAMAVMGIASAGLYLLIIVFGFFPAFVLRTCAPIL